MTERLNNWAGNYTYSTSRRHQPQTVEQIQDLVRQGRQLKGLGTRHSFNHLADTLGEFISLEHFGHAITVDRLRRTVTVGGGVRYGALCQHLAREGLALHNLASLPHISVAGACATATHGSGDRHGNLATAVAALELVAGSGEVVQLSRERDGEQFDGAVVGLGGLGVVTQLTLDLVPAFEMRQQVYENLPLAQLLEHFDAITASAYSVSLFTRWREARFEQVWLKRALGEGDVIEARADFFGATPAPGPRHPIDGLPTLHCTEQLGVPGPWHERLPHFRLDFTPSSGEELQSEYLVPRQHVEAALRVVAGLSDQIAPLLQISEVRTVAADKLWMSPCYRQACVALHFTWKQDWPAVRQLLPVLEEQLAPLQARPHWGKLFTLPPAQLPALYPRLADFRQLLRAYDPEGKFRNPFLDTYIFGDGG